MASTRSPNTFVTIDEILLSLIVNIDFEGGFKLVQEIFRMVKLIGSRVLF